VVTRFSFPFSPKLLIIAGFSATSFPLRVLSTAILNWGKAFVNKKLQKNAGCEGFVPEGLRADVTGMPGARFLKKNPASKDRHMAAPGRHNPAGTARPGVRSPEGDVYRVCQKFLAIDVL
jgi:hypothetical protein